MNWRELDPGFCWRMANMLAGGGDIKTRLGLEEDMILSKERGNVYLDD
jgi:hypothetical protein